jgi:protease-4
MHAQFIQAVADGRKAKVEDIRAIANGKVWTGEQALPLKLIDSLGDFETAVKETAKSVHIKGEPQIVRPEKDRKTFLDLMAGDLSEYIPTKEKLLEQHIGFYYLWK